MMRSRHARFRRAVYGPVWPWIPMSDKRMLPMVSDPAYRQVPVGVFHFRQKLEAWRGSAVFAAMLLLAGCAHEPVPVAKPDPPDEHLTMLCPELSDIPPNDGNRDVRKVLYAEWRAAYAACRDRHAGLARYAETVAK